MTEKLFIQKATKEQKDFADYFFELCKVMPIDDLNPLIRGLDSIAEVAGLNIDRGKYDLMDTFDQLNFLCGLACDARKYQYHLDELETERIEKAEIYKD